MSATDTDRAEEKLQDKESGSAQEIRVKNGGKWPVTLSGTRSMMILGRGGEREFPLERKIPDILRRLV